MTLQSLIFVSGVLHFGTLLASAAVPQVLDWKGELRKLDVAFSPVDLGAWSVHRADDHRLWNADDFLFGRSCVADARGPGSLRLHRSFLDG